MPTNEERREVAENLRIMTMGGCRYREQFYELLEETVLGLWDYYSFNELANHLADLIEPEPERTCRNEEAPSWHVFECSECGCVVCGGDERGHDSSKGAFNYCPNCGAKVVE